MAKREDRPDFAIPPKTEPKSNVIKLRRSKVEASQRAIIRQVINAASKELVTQLLAAGIKNVDTETLTRMINDPDVWNELRPAIHLIMAKYAPNHWSGRK